MNNVLTGIIILLMWQKNESIFKKVILTMLEGLITCTYFYVIKVKQKEWDTYLIPCDNLHVWL